MKRWFTLKEILAANDPGLPSTQQGLHKFAMSNNWMANSNLYRKRKGQGGAREFHVDLLPWIARYRLTAPDMQALTSAPARPEKEQARSLLWQAYSVLTEAQKKRCQFRFTVLTYAMDLYHSGKSLNKELAFKTAAHKHGVSWKTIKNWEVLTHGYEREDWLAVLVPSHGGGSGKAKCHPDAWETLKADYLRPEKPSFSACYRRMMDVAKAQDWQPIPTKKTLERRMKTEVQAQTTALAREGRDKLKALYPALTRTREHFCSMEAVNIDGHKFDVFVRWEDGSIGRPMMVAIQDLYSGKFVAWRLAKSECKETVQLAIGDMVKNYGVPEKMWLDNGRAFASKWITGGSKTRYRFKAQADDPAGLLTMLGVDCRWTTPYSGQSKPIERAFRDLCDTIAKHPACAGAYTGNSVDAKPENHGSKAIPIADFIALVNEEMPRHNAQPNRRSAVCRGVLSLDEAFVQGMEKRVLPVRRVSAEQERLWLLAAEKVKAKKNGEIHLFGNRYWCSQMVEHGGDTLTVRIDPENFHQPVHAYDLNGRYLCEVPVLEAAGFDDKEAAREHNSNRKKFVRNVKENLDLNRKMTVAELQRLTRTRKPVEEPAIEETNVVSPVFKRPTTQPKTAVAVGSDAVAASPEDDFMRAVQMMAQQQSPNPIAGIGSEYPANDAGFHTGGMVPPDEDE